MTDNTPTRETEAQHNEDLTTQEADDPFGCMLTII
jgi:hypothetical protein